MLSLSKLGALSVLVLAVSSLSASTPPFAPKHDVAVVSTHDAAPAPKVGSTPVQPPAKLPLQGITILLDPGHGGSDPGAMSGGLREKDVTLAVGLKLRTKLQALGATVMMTRDSDTTLTLQERRDASNRLCPDLFLSIHANSVGNHKISGIETYWWDDRDKSFADRLLHGLASGLNEISKWTLARNLFVLDGNNVPAALVEVGYLTNPRTRDLLKTSAYQDKVATILRDSIAGYLDDRDTARGCAVSTPSSAIKPFAVGSLKGQKHVANPSHHRAGKRRASVHHNGSRVGHRRSHVSER